MPLAISTYLAAGAPADSQDILHLGWTSDEREFLDADLLSMLAGELTAEVQAGLEYVQRYLVADPHAEQELAPAVASFFALAAAPSVTAGAGVGSLLHALSGLAAGKRVGVVATVYPDFPYWVRQSGGRCVPWAPGQEADPPEIIYMERPALLGGHLPLPELRRLCEAVRSRDVLVVVDESNANYYPPSFSAVPVAAELPNLAVIRGFSKAYGLGGLRLSYCVTSGARVTEQVRSCVPPMLASSLSLRLGRRVLLEGDITAGLRARIAAARGQAAAIMTAAGLLGIRLADGHLPYLLLDETDRAATGTRARLAAAGVLGKEHAYWDPAASSGSATIYRMSAPLAPARMDELVRRLPGGQDSPR